MAVEHEPEQELPYESIVHTFIDQAFRTDRRSHPTIEIDEIGAKGPDMRYHGVVALFPATIDPMETVGDFDSISFRYQEGMTLKRNPTSYFESVRLLDDIPLSQSDIEGQDIWWQVITNKIAQRENKPVIVMQIGYNSANEVGARVFRKPAYSLAQSVSIIKAVSHALMVQKAPQN